MAGESWGLWEREVESAAIAGTIKAASQGHGGLLLLEGLAGVGKTRLLGEAWAQATAAGAGTGWARCSELERDFAFGAVRQLIERLLMDTDADGREAWWDGAARQARPVFEAAAPDTGPAGDFAVLHGLYWLAANICQDRPLVLVIDDLQWCDTPSLRFLTYLLPRLEELPLLVVTALRSGEEPTDERLLAQLTADPAVVVLEPAPLTPTGAAGMLEEALPGTVEDAFAAACHTASGGNPLLLAELARTLAAEHLAPTTANAARITKLGPQAVARTVQTRLARLPEATLTLADAIAVLGDDTELATAATLADIPDPAAALEAVAQLEALGILHLGSEPDAKLSFVHPLVRAAVYHTLDYATRAHAHQRAAHQLAAADADPERVAAHLLHAPPAANPDTVEMLRRAAARAAARAIDRGAPGGAHTYLARALHEPPPDHQRLQVLSEAGQTALLIDNQAAANHFQQAYALQHGADPVQRAATAFQYASTLLYTGRIDECEQVLTASINQLPADEQDLCRRLQAWLVIIAINFAGHDQTCRYVADLYRLQPNDSQGGRMLDCALAIHAAHAGNRQATERARRGLVGGPMFEIAANFTNVAWWALITSDADDIIDMINDWSNQVQRRGDTAALTGIYVWRGWARLRRGQLTEAEADLRMGANTAEMTGLKVAEGVIAPQLAQCLMEQGRLEEATTILDAVSSAQIAPHLLDAQAQHSYLLGEYEQALETALTCQDQSTAVGLTNPAGIGWRTWAALSLHHLDRIEEACAVAAEDLTLARRWGAPRALGHALRINGLLHDGTTRQLDLLQQAVTTLEHSAAHLEHAKALADYGATLRRAGHRTDARPPLRQAVDVATRCGAIPLIDLARTELAAAGGRPRRTALTGPESLTPSERRVADLAAGGAANRQIAQQLYVTPKTVEVHLSSVYRKLDITTRSQLPQALTPGPAYT
jgi:DNA-binding CsgD family transcriptional regulator/tetratricopeptide (TPR) repeat protein